MEGVKYDKDKPRIGEMILDFKVPLIELCKVWEYGASKYSKSNWKSLNDGVNRYTNAMLRHLIAEEDSLYDEESSLLHAAHIAFNALARLYFILQERKLKPRDYIKDFFESNKSIFEECDKKLKYDRDKFLYLDKDIHTTNIGDINIID